MTEPITKSDLREFASDIKTHVSEQIAPLKEDINDHDIMLIGKNKMNGLVGDVRDMKTGVSISKWFAGVGGMAGLGAWIKSLLINHP